MSGPQESVPKLVLIAGSASRSANGELIDRAHGFVRELVKSILAAGDGFVVFVSSEPVNLTSQPLVFDWTVLREITVAFEGDAKLPRVVIVTSERARQEKMNPEQRRLIAMLVHRGLAEIVNLPDDIVTGGNVSDEQSERASAMIAIGGGKGVRARAHKLMERGRPVYPLDLKLGSLSEDGEGAIALHRAFMSKPLDFFSHTGASAQTKSAALSLQEPIQSIPEIAGHVVAILGNEFNAERLAAPTDFLVLTALAVELEAVRLAFEIPTDTPALRNRTGLNLWRAQLRRLDGQTVTCTLASFGAAGNVEAAATTATLLSEYQPKMVVMVGIAAGMRGKCALGDVVISERMVAYEGAALLGGDKTQARPETFRPAFSLQQDLTAYLSSPAQVRARLEKVRERHGIVLPETSEAGDVSSDVMPQAATIASGEKLLRDADMFRFLREIHGKVEVVEMEGIGIFTACAQHNTPTLVVRGISDFGDTTKDSQFHALAAKAAAVVAADLVASALIA